MQEKHVSRRELNRQRTQADIEDAATRLVDERGYAAVTVEEICEAAGISRRTFFNYFPTKDAAVFGARSLPFSDEVRERFLTEPTNDLLRHTLRFIQEAYFSPDDTLEIRHRRRRIAADPDVAAASLSLNRARALEMRELLEQRLEAEPQLRTMPGETVATEAFLIGSLIREALWLALAGPETDCNAPVGERIDRAMALITTFTKDIEW